MAGNWDSDGLTHPPNFPLAFCLSEDYASPWGWTHSGMRGLNAQSSPSLVLPEATLLWPQYV